MGPEVFWTDFSKNELRNIFTYHMEKGSRKVAEKIVKDIIEKAEILSDFPELGATEAFLKNRPQNF